MKRVLSAISLCLVLTVIALAQQPPADSPATKEDIERYLQVTHTREMMKQIMDAMAKQARQMAREQVSKNAQNLPPDVETRMDKMMDDMLKDFPIEEMLQAMIPVYQEHWTKADVDAMVAFYSTPTGQKILREMPATMAEAMQAMNPIMQKRMKAMMDRVQQEIAQMTKDSKVKPVPMNSPATPN